MILSLSIEIQFKIFGNYYNYFIFLNLSGFEDNASLFFAPLIMYSSTPSKSRKKHPNSFYILYLDRKWKIQYWKHRIFLWKIWWFLTCEKFFTPWISVSVKKNFVTWIVVNYLIKNDMKTIFFSKKVGFIAQNFHFHPLKTFFSPEHL